MRSKIERWGLGASAIYLVVSLALYGVASSHNPSSDGFYSWIYARSLAYGGDLDFTDDYAACGDPFSVGMMTAAHRPANFFYIGPAVFWTPLVWILKPFVHGTPWENGCKGATPNIVLVMTSFAGAIVVLATSAIVRRFVSARIAATATLLVTLGGHLIYFTGMSASYSHAYDAMCVAVYLYLLVRIREDPGRRALWIAAGLALGLAILQRSSNVGFFCVAIVALLDARRLAVIAGVAFASGLAPLLLANHAIYGRWLLYTHGPHFIHFGHAHPLLLIFDQRGGLFAWAPILWLAVPGFVMLARRRDARWLVVPLVLFGAIELYVSSAALDWQGARRLVNLTPLAALSMAMTLDPIVAWFAKRRERATYALAATAIAGVTWASSSLAIGYRVNAVEWDRPLTTGARFGNAQTATLETTEHAIGPLTALPAAWLFAARYRLSPSAFGEATHPLSYARNHQTLEFDRMGFGFATPESARLLRGLHADIERGSACFEGHAASFVFAAQWPFATRARFTYDATRSGELAIGSRSFFGTRVPWERARVDTGVVRELIVHIPIGGFDSGVNEIELTATEPDGLCLRDIELVDDTHYPASPESLASFPVTLWHARNIGGAREGGFASTATFASTIVEVHAVNDDLVMKVGTTRSDGSITWRAEKTYDHGSHPEIKIDAATGHGVEVHDGSSGLWSHELDVFRD